jgi:hypothetical protein
MAFRRDSMATTSYQHALETVEALPSEERLRLIEEVRLHTHVDLTGEKPVSIMDLRGLGAEIWKGIDAQEYVNAERVLGSLVWIG